MSIKGWLEKYDNQRIIIIIFFFLLVAAPLIRPLALPVAVTEPTRAFYKEVEGIKPDDIIVVDFNFDAGNWGEMGSGGIALLHHLAAKRATTDFDIIFMATEVAGTYMFQRCLDAVGGWQKMNMGKYGENYVYLGFMAGGEPMIAAMASNFKSIYRNDAEGTPVEQLPLMMKVNTVKDIRMVIQFNHGGDADKYRKQWGIPFGVRVIEIIQGIHVPVLAMYLAAGQVHGYLASIRGCAEYELLINKPGEAITSTDALSMSHLLIIGVIVAGNFVYFFKEKRGVS